MLAVTVAVPGGQRCVAAMPSSADETSPRLDRIEVRSGVVRVHVELPDVAYDEPLTGKRHRARVVIDFVPHGWVVDNASLFRLASWLHDQRLLAEDIDDVAVCVAEAMATTVEAPVEVTVEQERFNGVALTLTVRGYPVGRQAQDMNCRRHFLNEPL